MPRDSAPTRQAILDAALAVLRRAGLAGFSVEAVARQARVAKGLVIYHYRSRAALVGLCVARLAAERWARLSAALSRGPGVAGIDSLWAELVRQQDDGTARAWLSLTAAGLVPADAGELEDRARAAVVDGCAAALAAGVPVTELRPAYEALWLALLPVLEGEAD